MFNMRDILVGRLFCSNIVKGFEQIGYSLMVLHIFCRFSQEKLWYTDQMFKVLCLVRYTDLQMTFCSLKMRSNVFDFFVSSESLCKRLDKD